MLDLNKNEEVIIKIKKHWMYFFYPAIFSLLFIFPVVWLVYRIIRYCTDEITLTNQRFNTKTGIFSVNNISTKLDKIQNVYYRQNFLGRIVGYGDILIQSAATLGVVEYSFVANPASIKSLIETAIEDYSDNKHKRQNAELIKQLSEVKSN